MPATIEQILEEALALPDDSRLLLAERLVESVNSSTSPDLEARQLAEVQRRMADVEAGRVELVPGSDALREVREAVRRTR
ncbi:MAG: addiction module protein [Verrucomicrobia bacterium]|nr:addiction module protein [Verrucomicrobiota bacterium]